MRRKGGNYLAVRGGLFLLSRRARARTRMRADAYVAFLKLTKGNRKRKLFITILSFRPSYPYPVISTERSERSNLIFSLSAALRLRDSSATVGMTKRGIPLLFPL